MSFYGEPQTKEYFAELEASSQLYHQQSMDYAVLLADDRIDGITVYRRTCDTLYTLLILCDDGHIATFNITCTMADTINARIDDSLDWAYLTVTMVDTPRYDEYQRFYNLKAHAKSKGHTTTELCNLIQGENDCQVTITLESGYKANMWCLEATCHDGRHVITAHDDLLLGLTDLGFRLAGSVE